MGDRQAPEPLLLVQELANTLDIETGADELAGPEGLARFVSTHGLTRFGLGKPDLEGLRELREALRAACLAHTSAGAHADAAARTGAAHTGAAAVAAQTAETLERHLGAAPLVLRIGERGEAALEAAPGLTGLPAFTAHLAARIATAASDGTWQRLKACETHDCQWVYYDRSPAGRSRWCTMAVCGSRAKMRAYRARRAR
ncbi:CGNR zinc finger domain-containing protein [Streptomyces spirodelae]|uniref:CGNR zinc finger domain-containing protein n=1 Tax=Streptomyces spirodelae TaxID=2812904 RepID=A0ABS3X2R7_9ACTN|nr:CGNR zinc finger domain-containing protein [Streptomyces spirodelae]MBO8189382.1 CGNR zinc finger domain-containing protein [Streptomyces spirodelae]